MSRLIVIALLVGLVAGGVYFFWNYRIERHFEDGKFAYLKITRRSDQSQVDQPDGRPPARAAQPTIRMATFNLSRLDERKLSNRRVSDVLAKIIPQFELVAVQGLHGQTQAAVVRLVERINAATGRQYGFAACPPGQRDPAEEYSAFLFDETALEVDRSTLHLVADQANRFRHPPLVAAFRVRGPAEAEAFTFTLINVQSTPEHTAAELDLLRDVCKAVRDDGRGEDDIILLGDLGADENHLGKLAQMPDMTIAVTSTPTTVRGTRRVDNILFDRRATTEFTGRSGVVDMMRECDLTMEEALEVAEHLPVWAEFSSYEGGQPGRVAAGTETTVR